MAELKTAITIEAREEFCRLAEKIDGAATRLSRRLPEAQRKLGVDNERADRAGRFALGVAPDGDGAGSGEWVVLVGRPVFKAVLAELFGVVFCADVEVLHQYLDEGPQDKGRQQYQPGSRVDAERRADHKEDDEEEAFDSVFDQLIHTGILTWRT